MHINLKSIFKILKNALLLLRKNDPLILSSSTAFFATFSLSPIIIIIVNVLSLYFKSEIIRNRLFMKISGTFGTETAQEIKKIVDNFRALESSVWITVFGSVFFIFVATTLLSIVRKAIHKIWRIREKTISKLRSNIKERTIEILMIVAIGLLFLLSLSLDTSVAIFRDYLDSIFSGVNPVVIRILNIIFSIIVVTAWFTMVFKLLPEAVVAWKVAFVGGLFTGLLFTLGKFFLGKFLIHGKIASVFGASASIALLLLFIFYSSFILYYGAAFTHEYALHKNKRIKPGKYADEYEEKILGVET